MVIHPWGSHRCLQLLNEFSDQRSEPPSGQHTSHGQLLCLTMAHRAQCRTVHSCLPLVLSLWPWRRSPQPWESPALIKRSYLNEGPTRRDHSGPGRMKHFLVNLSGSRPWRLGGDSVGTGEQGPSAGPGSCLFFYHQHCATSQQLPITTWHFTDDTEVRGCSSSHRVLA